METLDLEPLLVGFLVFARMSALLMSLPVTGNRGVPMMLRMAIALPMAAVLYPTVEGAAVPNTIPMLATAVVCEVILGVAMGFVVSMLTGAVAIASEILASTIGLSMASMLDPMTGSQGSTLGALAQVLATGVFFTMDIHLGCVRALGDSLQTLPPGQLMAPLGAGEVVIEVASNVLTLGVRLAAPLMFFSLMVNFALMVLGRMAPGLQLFFSIGTSFTVIAGILLLGSALPALLHVEAMELAGSFDLMRRVVASMSGG